MADHDSRALVDYLLSLVHGRKNGALAELRRPGAPTEARIVAGWYGGTEHRELFEQVAFLFAVYHRGSDKAHAGNGNLGAAARRIGQGDQRGPKNPGATRLLNRIVSSRRIPWRHLQHAVTRLRTCDQKPPHWATLADDLVDWNNRAARVPYGWSVAFHVPSALADRSYTTPTARKDTAQ